MSLSKLDYRTKVLIAAALIWLISIFYLGTWGQPLPMLVQAGLSLGAAAAFINNWRRATEPTKAVDAKPPVSDPPTLPHSHTPISPPAPLHSLPAAPRDFTGREAEIDKLCASLTSGTNVAISGRAENAGGIASLAGMGGIGKTALALVVADRLKPRYPDAQIYIEMKGTSPTPLSPIEAMVTVIHAFQPTADLRQASKEDIAALYATLLDGKQALLLLDNAFDAAQVKPLLPPHTCAALVTSRRYFTLPGLTPLRLDLLPPDEAQALLLKICPRVDSHAAELAKRCGYIPLALRIAASTLAENITLRVADYAQDLGDRRVRLAALKSESDPALDVEASIDAGYTLLSDETQARLRALAVFPVAFDADAAASAWGMEEKDARAVLSELVRYSLVEYDEESGRYSLHDLVAGFGEARLSEEEWATAQLRHAQHYLEVASAADDLYLKGGENVLLALNLFDAEWEHIRTGQAWAVANAEGSEAARRLCSEYPNAAHYCIALRLRARDRIEWLDPAVTAARKLGDKRIESYHLGNLGISYRQFGEVPKAIEYYVQTLAIDRAIGDRRGEGNSLGNLGLAYADLGEVRKAIEYHEQALRIAREIADRRGEGNDLGNLGSAYYVLGEVPKATEYYKQQLAITREIGDRQGEGNALSGLGLAFAALGEVPKAIEYYEQALAIRRAIGDRRGESADLGNLGNAYVVLGEVWKAIEYYEQVLVIHRAIGDRRAEGADLGNLGSAHAALGELRKAIEYYEQALAIHREIGDRRGEGADLFNLGEAHGKLGDVPRALQCAEDALAIFVAIEDPTAEKTREWVEELRAMSQ